ncbi:hypothetical protein [Embleya sp. NPDC050493]|uniref:hypothetical protein n=1 Tax=Embleya sp. NPDC050493 TaxID=3363989 RepID=UPI00378AE7A8
MVGHTDDEETNLIMNTHVIGQLPFFELTPTAAKVLSTMIRLQQPGGFVEHSQRAMGIMLGIPESAVSRGIRELCDKGLVLRPNRRNWLHPAIAGYTSIEEMNEEIQRAAQSPLVPPLLIPNYQVMPPREGKAKLSAVS